MKRICRLLCVMLFVYISIYAQAKDDQCFVCHESTGDGIAELYKHDVHFAKNISCNACHGGNNKTDDMEIAMSEKEGFTSVPKGDEISNRCAGCHSNAEQMKKYNSSLPVNQQAQIQNSVHWQKSISGNSHILQCTTCHNAHGIVPVKNPLSPVYSLNLPSLCAKCHNNAVYMRSYNPSLPVDQYQKYRTSVHGLKNKKGDANAADCSDCHGTHEIRKASDVKSKVYPTNIPKTCSSCHSNAEYMSGYKIPTDQYKKFSSSVHGIALLEKNDLNAPACNNCHGNHAATPPGVESISKVCGTCHVLNAELFSGSPHKKAFDEKNYPECETCHGNHHILTATNELLGVGEKEICSKCHKENLNTEGFKSAQQMRKLIDSLDVQILFAKRLVDEAEQKGMEISEAKFKLRDANQAKQETRTVIHSFDLEKFREVVEQKGLTITSSVIDESKRTIDDYYFRRYGLGISVLIISGLAFTIFLYIRKIEKNKKS
ncbi:MAG: cytochrome c3 family protein [Bacteroidota bacterium]